MGTVTNVLLCSFVVVIVQGLVKLERDRPFRRVTLNEDVVLECCYTIPRGKTVTLTWVKNGANIPDQHDVLFLRPLAKVYTKGADKTCGFLELKSVNLNDTGLYRCFLNDTANQVYSHGTFLQVYKLLEKTINLKESTKNKILTAEGILLLLCVLVPSATFFCQSKKLKELEKKKVTKEEENIYQGLNLDDCCTTYDQIERSQAHGPYQDVCNIMEEEEEIQLEKP